MDNRIKKLALEGLINRVSADPGAGIEPAYLLKKEFVDKVIEIISSLDEGTMLYLSGDIKLPEVGSKLILRNGGEDVECVVEAVNFTDAAISISYFAPKVYYFKTTEAAEHFRTTGEKGTYSNWDNEYSDEYAYKAKYEVNYHKRIKFDQL